VVVVDVTVVVGAAEVVVGATVVVVDVTVVVGAAEVVVGATVVGVSLAAVSVVPPEQAETNNARIRNQAVFRFMIGVCHGTPERFSVTTCALGRPVVRSETTERLEISGLSSIIRLVDLGGNRNTEVCPSSPPGPLAPVEPGMCV